MSDANWDGIKSERERAKKDLEEAEKYFESQRQLPVMLGKIFDEKANTRDYLIPHTKAMTKEVFIEVVINLLNSKKYE